MTSIHLWFNLLILVVFSSLFLFVVCAFLCVYRSVSCFHKCLSRCVCVNDLNNFFFRCYCYYSVFAILNSITIIIIYQLTLIWLLYLLLLNIIFSSKCFVSFYYLMFNVRDKQCINWQSKCRKYM